MIVTGARATVTLIVIAAATGGTAIGRGIATDAMQVATKTGEGTIVVDDTMIITTVMTTTATEDTTTMLIITTMTAIVTMGSMRTTVEEEAVGIPTGAAGAQEVVESTTVQRIEAGMSVSVPHCIGA